MVKAAIFDMDGLLIDSEPLWRRVEVEVFNGVGWSITEEQCKQTMGLRLDEVIAYWKQVFPAIEVDEAALNNAVLDAMEVGIRKEGKALPGVYQTLELCKQNNLKLALASSSPMRLILATLKALEIEDYFSVVKSAEHESFGKPHPAVFISAIQKLEVSPENAVIFEDSFHGVVAGLAAKAKVVAVPDQEEFQQERFKAATVLLSSLEQFNNGILNQL